MGFSIDSLGYVGAGANELSAFYKDFYAYHPSTNTWTKIADFGGIARDGGCGFAVNGKGYVCFGQDSTLKVYNDMWEYDPVANIWIQKANNRTSMLTSNGFVICDNIYVGGDSTDGVDRYKKFWKYNTVSDTWIQEANVPGIKTTGATAFSINDTGYFGFGADSTVIVQNSFFKFYAGDSCNKTTGYNAITIISEISIYPNPTKQNLNLNFDRQVAGPVTLSIMDITGREVISSQWSDRC